MTTTGLCDQCAQATLAVITDLLEGDTYIELIVDVRRAVARGHNTCLRAGHR